MGQLVQEGEVTACCGYYVTVTTRRVAITINKANTLINVPCIYCLVIKIFVKIALFHFLYWLEQSTLKDLKQ